MRGKAIGLDRRPMLRRAVAGIVLPTISWVLAVQLPHHLVARDFRENRGGGDRVGEMVALDHGGLRAGQARLHVAVDDGVRGEDRQGLERAAHGHEGGAQDVEAVDLLDGRLAQRPDRLDPQLHRDLFAHLGRQALGIIERAEQPGREPGERQDRRAGNHRPRQRPAPRLIDAADHGARLATQRDLVAEGGHGECVAGKSGVGGGALHQRLRARRLLTFARESRLGTLRF
jgi:hypothetical protein